MSLTAAKSLKEEGEILLSNHLGELAKEKFELALQQLAGRLSDFLRASGRDIGPDRRADG